MVLCFVVGAFPEKTLLRWMRSKVMLGPRATLALRPALLVLIESVDPGFLAWTLRSSVRRWCLKTKAATIGSSHRWLLDGLPFIRASAVEACGAARVLRRGKGKSRLGDKAETAIILGNSVVFMDSFDTTMRVVRLN